MAKVTLEFVKQVLAVVEVNQFGPDKVVDVEGLDRLRLHVHVPHLHGKVVAREDIPAVRAELDVVDGGKDLGEERFVRGILLFHECWDGRRFVSREKGKM